MYGSDGTVYVGSWDNKLYAINGKTGGKWEFETVVLSRHRIGWHGVRRVSRQQALCHQSIFRPRLNSPWPMFGQNARRTALAENRQNLTETPNKPALNIDTPNVGTKI